MAAGNPALDALRRAVARGVEEHGAITEVALPEAIYDAYAALQAGDSTADVCRERLGELRRVYGDRAFEVARVRALVALQRANGGV